MSYPSYIKHFENGVLEKRLASLEEIMKSCTMCPHQCRVDRMSGERGKCNTGFLPTVASYSPHFGEESPLVGIHGSGTIFFSNCNLACIFCQNYDISHLGYGREVEFERLAEMMLDLQQRGCHNINLVSPSHMVYAIFKALDLAVSKGLKLPIVYNTGGYDAVETIGLLEGIIDIYMPDIKYMDEDTSFELSGARDYPSCVKEAVSEMHRQVGDLVIDKRGIAARGLLVRHLVLPNERGSSKDVFRFLASLSSGTYVNIMDQYRPEYRARECFDIGRRVTLDEFDQAVESARGAGLWRFAR